MQYVAEATAGPKVNCAVKDTVGRAFLMAHLLTADTACAERVTMEAIGSWNPGDETESVFLRNVLDAAVRAPSRSNEAAQTGSCFPAELRAVLELEPGLRRCFVLRILVGLPKEECARLLRLDSHSVERYTHAALQCLGARSGGGSLNSAPWFRVAA
jgi:hypothetical protein